jgi:hypothetical protein
MNQQDQINIIQAHMAGKTILVRSKTRYAEGANTEGFVPLIPRNYNFDFQGEEYKIEPRKLELFMSLPSGVLQALGREAGASGFCTVSNMPPKMLHPGHVIVKIHCIEPES